MSGIGFSKYQGARYSIGGRYFFSFKPQDATETLNYFVCPKYKTDTNTVELIKETIYQSNYSGNYFIEYKNKIYSIRVPSGLHVIPNDFKHKQDYNNGAYLYDSIWYHSVIYAVSTNYKKSTLYHYHWIEGQSEVIVGFSMINFIEDDVDIDCLIYVTLDTSNSVNYSLTERSPFSIWPREDTNNHHIYRIYRCKVPGDLTAIELLYDYSFENDANAAKFLCNRSPWFFSENGLKCVHRDVFSGWRFEVNFTSTGFIDGVPIVTDITDETVLPEPDPVVPPVVDPVAPYAPLKVTLTRSNSGAAGSGNSTVTIVISGNTRTQTRILNCSGEYDVGHLYNNGALGIRNDENPNTFLLGAEHYHKVARNVDGVIIREDTGEILAHNYTVDENGNLLLNNVIKFYNGDVVTVYAVKTVVRSYNISYTETNVAVFPVAHDDDENPGQPWSLSRSNNTTIEATYSFTDSIDGVQIGSGSTNYVSAEQKSLSASGVFFTGTVVDAVRSEVGTLTVSKMININSNCSMSNLIWLNESGGIERTETVTGEYVYTDSATGSSTVYSDNLDYYAIGIYLIISEPYVFPESCLNIDFVSFPNYGAGFSGSQGTYVTQEPYTATIPGYYYSSSVPTPSSYASETTRVGIYDSPYAYSYNESTTGGGNTTTNNYNKEYCVAEDFVGNSLIKASIKHIHAETTTSDTTTITKDVSYGMTNHTSTSTNTVTGGSGSYSDTYQFIVNNVIIYQGTHSVSYTNDSESTTQVETSTFFYPTYPTCKINGWEGDTNTSHTETPGSATDSGYVFTPVYVDIKNSIYAFIETYFEYDFVEYENVAKSAKLILVLNGVQQEQVLDVQLEGADLWGHIIDRCIYYSHGVSPPWAIIAPPNGTVFHGTAFNFRGKNGFNKTQDTFWFGATLNSFNVETHPGYSPWPSVLAITERAQTAMALLTNGTEVDTAYSGPLVVKDNDNEEITITSPEVWFPILVSRY